MRAGAAFVAAAAFCGVRTSLAAIFFSGGNRAGAIGMGASVLGGLGHDLSPNSFFLLTGFRCANQPSCATVLQNGTFIFSGGSLFTLRSSFRGTLGAIESNAGKSD
jgi:hypothetical protein